MSVRIEWNTEAMYEIRRDPGVVAELESVAQEVADRANSSGEGTYAVGSRQGRKNPQGRWRASVVTADAKAMLDNARNNTLIRALSD